MKHSLEKTFEKAESKKSASKKRKKPKSPPRVASIIGLGVGLILALNLAIYLQNNKIESARMTNVQKLSQQRADIIATSATRYLENLKQQITFFTKKPTLAAHFALGNQRGIDAAKENMFKNIDGLFAIQLFGNGSVQLNDEAKPPVRFTQLEMIRNAQKRKGPLPEASKYENRWIVQWAVPIPFDPSQEAIGVMLLSFNLDVLESLATTEKVALGQTVLQQKFGTNKALDIFSVGSGTLGSPAIAKIANSYWQVRFTPSYYLYENAKKDTVIIYFIIFISCAVVIAACFVIGRIIGRGVEAKRQEKALITGAAKVSENASGEVAAAPPVSQADILDVDITEEDEDLLGLEDVEATQPVQAITEEMVTEAVADDDPSVPDVIFRAYDIRGIAEEQITKSLAQRVGQALGSEAIDNGQDTLIVARDARLSSPALAEYLVRGILSTGCHVLNIGTVPTPLMYFATATLKQTQSGVMVTASHNPGEYNGFKIVMNGKSRCDDDIKAIRRRILKNDVYDGNGEEKHYDVVPEYIDTIFSDVALAGDISMVIDAANGVTGNVAPRLFEELGCHVTPLFCDLDGKFPNHSPDPLIESNLQALIEKVKDTQADLGVAFDGDGDRLVVVTGSGKIIWPDKLLLMFAKDIVSRNPGADVIFDVKSTRHLASLVTSYGGRPIMWKTGHAPMKNKMAETGALIGGEYSGHIFIKDRWFGFDDGMYAAARLIEIVSLQGESLDMMFEQFPDSPDTPEIRVPIDEEKKFDVVERLAKTGDFGQGRITNIDGVRVDFPNGWGLVRASNTSANLTLRFEADDAEALHTIQAVMVKELRKVDPSISVDWGK